ncbi:hypothetical protein [Paenibacillus apiarius]|uniref:hypothetical protein n=1 Tax=Paenibacillus apiarius TaxID=46240 RepID=UPI003B3B0B48
MLSTSQKGALAEKVVETRIIECDAFPFLPSVSAGETDIIAEYRGNIYKIQVKSRYPENGRLLVDTRRPSAKKRTYSSGAFDILAVVDLSSNRVAFIDRDTIPSERFRFFITKDYNLQGKPAEYVPLMFDDFLDFRKAVERLTKHVA